MDVQQWTTPGHDDPTGSDGAPATPSNASRRWWLVVAGAAIVFGLTGGAAGVVVGDDGDRVADLRSEVEAAVDENAGLEDDLRDADAERARLIDQLEQCRDSADLALDVADGVDEFAAAALTAEGIAEDPEAIERAGLAFLSVLSVSAAMEQAAGDCVAHADEQTEATS
jgi:hypothetical protein